MHCSASPSPRSSLPGGAGPSRCARRAAPGSTLRSPSHPSPCSPPSSPATCAGHKADSSFGRSSCCPRFTLSALRHSCLGRPRGFFAVSMPKSADFVHLWTGMQYGRRGARIAAWAVLAVCLICPSARAADCMGDCDGSASVTVNELIMAVNISLALGDPSECDVYGGPVAINLLIKAVNNLLTGCQVAGDPTETPPEATASTEQ